MGNMFLGFPVPRAKIAEMIEGYAAPRFPYENTIFHTLFESLDGYSKATSGGGSLTNHPNYVTFIIYGTNGDHAQLTKYPEYPHLANTWDKPRSMKARLHIDLTAGVTGTILLAPGNFPTENAIGFLIYNGSFGVISCAAGDYEAYEIADWTTPAEHDVLLAWDYEPPAYPKFYVDGELVYTATTRKPTGTDYADWWLNLLLANQAPGDAITVHISEYMFHQKDA